MATVRLRLWDKNASLVATAVASTGVSPYNGLDGEADCGKGLKNPSGGAGYAGLLMNFLRRFSPQLRRTSMDCNGVCESDFESSAFQIGLAILAIVATAVWVARIARSAISNRRAIERAYEAVNLQQEIEIICNEIAALPSPPLTIEGIPKRFPSREAAQTFGERWSRGGPASFRARDIDAAGRDENHPKFNREEVGGGILYPTPALFFGMDDPYRDDDGWYVEFLRAKKSWLEYYSTQLKDGVRPY